MSLSLASTNTVVESDVDECGPQPVAKLEVRIL
jgi:hypothetical protein